jgi:beta-phosphoglucomutase-like phosphatase (HAD superfamily)
VRALILDYNGVIVNDEPLHKEALRKALASAGIRFGDDEYFTRYLGIADRDIVRDALAGRGTPPSAIEDEIDHLLSLKALAYRDLSRRDLPEVPGAARFILAAAERYPIAVASGAIRVEVEDGLYLLGVRDAITAIVTIEDVARGKPDPGILLAAREAILRIARTPGAPHPLDASEPAAAFLVIEDSPAGLAAASAAGMPAIGVATSRPREALAPAVMVVDDLAGLTLEAIEAI